MDGWNCSSTQRHDLLRLLYDAQIKSGKHAEAANTMISLLSAYTDDDASQAREDAHRFIHFMTFITYYTKNSNFIYLLLVTCVTNGKSFDW